MTQTFSDGTPVPEPEDYGYPDPPVTRQFDDHPLLPVLTRIANALDAMKAPSAPPGAPQRPAGPPTSNGGPPPAHKGSGDTEKMSKKVFAICKNQGWDIADVGQQLAGHYVGADSRKWSAADLMAVLDGFKEWGVG